MVDPVLVTNPARPRDHGSGFVIRRLDGAGAQVVTCSHVVRALGADGLVVAGRPAKVVVDLAGDGVDLAVLAVPGLDEPAPLELQRGTAGDAVTLLGFEPAGGGPVAVPHAGRLATRSITAIGGHNRPAWHLALTDGAIAGGHSGGPVVHARTGKVVGVIAMGPEQQGGKDGVAVAIENLLLWKDAPAIAAARAPSEDPASTSSSSSGDGTSSDSLLPSIVRPARRWWWLATLAGGLAIGGATLALQAWSSASASPSHCAVPDLRDGWDAVPVERWCPDSIEGEEACVAALPDDGGLVTGTCRGTDAIGRWTWRSTDGLATWTARFATGDEHPRAVFEREVTRRLPQATVTERLRVVKGALVAGNKLVDSSHAEVVCVRRTGTASVVRDHVDLAEPEHTAMLTVPDGVLRCALDGARATGCRIADGVVGSGLAQAAYARLEDAEEQIRLGNLPRLPALPHCGDGVQQADEQCDEGVETVRCTAACKLPRCGDGVKNGREACDDGGETATCDADCTPVACGDRTRNVTALEACDPPRIPGTATCERNCLAPMCGDGIVNAAAREVCDPPPATGTRTCETNCAKPRCGDGITNTATGEQCDDGRRTTRCTAQCKLVFGMPGTAPTTPGSSTTLPPKPPQP